MKKLFTLGVVLTTILWTMGVGAFIPVASAATLSAGDLIKASGNAVYFYAADGKRYTFPTQSTYMTWYSDFTSVKTITDNELSAIDLAGNIVVRPGTKLVKITTVPKVYAVQPNGELVWVASEDAAKALYGDNWASRIIDVPDGFWVNYTATGESLDGTAYPAGQLVKHANFADIYYVNTDGSWSKIANDSAFAANGFKMGDVVTTTLTMPSAGSEITEAMYHDTSQGGGAGSTAVIAGNLSVSLSANTPAANYVSKGAQNVTFAKFNVSATNSVKIDKIVLRRNGLGYDSDLETVRLYDGVTQIGSDQSLNTTTHQVTFNNVNWTVSGTKTLTVKANVAASPSGTNDYFELVTIESNGSVSGLPVAGNAMQFSALTVNDLYVNAVSGTATVISGASDEELGCFTFESAIGSASVAEAFNIDSIKFTNTGSASDSELSNFVLKQSSTVIGTASTMSNGEILIDMTDAPYELKASTNKRICLYGDITNGITVSKTFKAQIAETSDVVAVGQDSSAQALIELSSGTAFTSQTGKTVTIGQGDAYIANDSAYDISDGTVVIKGTPDNKFGAFKLTAGSTEGVRLTKVRFVVAGSNVAGTDFSNWQLYKIVDGAEVLIPVYGSVSGTNITFEDTVDGLLDVAKSESETFVVKADISTSVAGNELPYIYINVTASATTNTEVKIKGLESGDYITDGVTVNSGADATARDTELNLDVDAYGTLTVSAATTSPTSDTIAKGTDNVRLLDINLYATGEDMEVTDLILTLFEDVAWDYGTSTDFAESGDVTNIILKDEDGNQVGSTCSAPSSGECSFGISYTVPKDENKVLKVYGNIPSGATGYLYASVYDASTFADEITTTGVSSQADITEGGSNFKGGLMTLGAPEVVAAMATSPIASSYVSGSSAVTAGKLLLSAGTTEGVKVTSIKISVDDDATLGGAEASVASANWESLKLVDANTGIQYGLTKNLTDGGASAVDYANFTGITNLNVSAGQTTTINIIATPTGTTGSFYFGVVDASTEITGSGVLSGGSATITPNGSTIKSAPASLTSSGRLKVNKAADMPVSAQLVAGTTGNEFAKYKLEAVYEDIDVTVLPLYYTGTVADIANVKLYLDGQQIGDTNGYILSGATKTVNLTSGTLVVTKDVPVYLTMKVELRPKAQLTSSASSVYLGIGDTSGDNSEWGATGAYNITAKGVSSGTALTKACINTTAYDGATATAGCDTGAAAGYAYGSNAFTVHDGILTVSLDSSSPSGVQTGAPDETLMVFKLNAVGDEITVNEMEFCWSGNAAITGGGATYLKSSDDTTTYASLTDAEYDAYWTLRGDGTGALTVEPMFDVPASMTDANCFSWGDTADATGATANSNVKAFTSAVKVGSGSELKLKLIGDTTGAANPKTLKLTIGPSAFSTCDDDGDGADSGDTSCAATTSGIEWQATDAVAVDLTTTKNLPLSSYTLSY